MDNTKSQNQKITKSRFFCDPRGSVLLLTLLLLSFFLFIGLVWATLVFRGLRIIEDTSNAVVAFAATESGIEDGLYQIQKLGASFTAVNGQSALLSASTARWQRNAYDRKDILVIDLIAAGQSVSIPLYNADFSESGAIPAAFGASSLIVTWDTGPQSVDASLESWVNSALSAPQLVSIGNGSPAALDPTRAYRVTLKPSATIRNVRIRATTLPIGQGATVDIPQPRTIESTGSYRGTDQAIRMRIPRVAPF